MPGGALANVQHADLQARREGAPVGAPQVDAIRVGQRPTVTRLSRVEERLRLLDARVVDQIRDVGDRRDRLAEEGDRRVTGQLADRGVHLLNAPMVVEHEEADRGRVEDRGCSPLGVPGALLIEARAGDVPHDERHARVLPALVPHGRAVHAHPASLLGRKLRTGRRAVQAARDRGEPERRLPRGVIRAIVAGLIHLRSDDRVVGEAEPFRRCALELGVREGDRPSGIDHGCADPHRGGVQHGSQVGLGAMQGLGGLHLRGDVHMQGAGAVRAPFLVVDRERGDVHVHQGAVLVTPRDPARDDFAPSVQCRHHLGERKLLRHSLREFGSAQRFLARVAVEAGSPRIPVDDPPLAVADDDGVRDALQHPGEAASALLVDATTATELARDEPQEDDPRNRLEDRPDDAGLEVRGDPAILLCVDGVRQPCAPRSHERLALHDLDGIRARTGSDELAHLSANCLLEVERGGSKLGSVGGCMERYERCIEVSEGATVYLGAGRASWPREREAMDCVCVEQQGPEGSSSILVRL